jgi:hypothetical protein
MAQPNTDVHVLRSWLALRKHQHGLAIAEAEQGLKLSPNDTEALEALSEALIYSGQPERGIELAERAMRQNPTLFARPLYLLGLAEFALGHPDKAIEHLNRALRQAPGEANFSGLLAAAYGELGLVEQAKAAFETFILGWSERFAEAGGSARSLSISVSIYPFSNPGVLDRLANGFRVAGARVGIGQYLPLHSTNRVSGPEIKSLLFAREVKGTDPWRQDLPWRQRRMADGTVQHFGIPIHAGVREGAYGVSRIKDDLLCETWPEFTQTFEICVVIFRIPDRNARIRWGDFVMITDTGPKPFSLVE